MQTIRYSVPHPWPQGFSLGEAIEVKKCEFSATKVTEYVGRVGIIPRTWCKEKQDWYVDILDFVCIRTVHRQEEKILGPFRISKTTRSSAAQRSGSGRSVATAKPCKDETMHIRQEHEHKEMERRRQQQTLTKERKKPRHTVNRNAQEAAKANQTKVTKKPRRVPEKMLDVSLTIGIPGENVDEKLFDVLVNWLEQRAEIAVLALERGDAFLQLHLQGMLRAKSSSTTILKWEIKEVIGWQWNPPVGGSVCLKSLREKGLHTVSGLIGYCLKDEGAAHFRFYSKNITEEQKAEGRRMHSIYGASEYKHKLELTPANILGRALQFRKYRVKNPVSITFRRCIAEMLRSGQYIPAFRWLTSAKISRLRAERIWRACTTPQSVEVADIETIFFGLETPARYFETEEKKTAAETDGPNVDDETELQNKTSAESDDDDNQLPGQSTASDDEDRSRIPVVELQKPVDSGVDLHRVRDALLQAGFAVGMNTTVKEDNPIDHIPEYFKLWD
ncbi:hypothetical protein R1flu_014057 [Riccia fluitans]|uniref:Replitron HUH endonuclease domain-containing protein n=1 Tax=Riccia fluitans TaxID=41844 RepID=A0ABD1YF06_9MARC